MAKTRPHSTEVGEGANAIGVRYSDHVRKGSDFLQVEFNGPDGAKVRKSTTGKYRGVIKGVPQPDEQFHIDAARHIVRAFQSMMPQAAQKKTWEEALDEAIGTIEDDARPDTISGYRIAVQRVQDFLPEVKYPQDMTAELAQRFGRLLLSTPYTRGKSTIQRKRTPVTLSMYVRTLSGLWGHFQELGILRGNPWSDFAVKTSVKKALKKADKIPPYVPTEEHITKFFAYVRTRYPQWHSLHALLSLKLQTASRSHDVTQLLSEQVRDTPEGGSLVFSAKQTKTKTDRFVPLSKELFQELQAVKGNVWLFENIVKDWPKFRPGKNAIPTTYSPRKVQALMENIFQEYSDANPDVPRISPHDFRRRTITLMVTATQSVDVTAQALGLNPNTARKHYLDAEAAFNARAAFAKVGDKLRPQELPEPAK